MALPDNQIDALIESALQSRAMVSSQQKHLAWERLSERVKDQVILPPVLVIEEKSFATRFFEGCGAVWQQFSDFAIQEDRYERARLNRSLMKYNGLNHTGEIIIQYMEPLRMAI